MKRLRKIASDFAYNLYDHRLTNRLSSQQLPHHVGVILDGNRRWAAGQGSSSAHGHRAGGAKITEFLTWCQELGVEVVTLWLLSTDNLSRDEQELETLLSVIEDTVTELATSHDWKINPVGSLNLLPDHTQTVLKNAADRTKSNTGVLVNVAVGYGGRREVVDAVKSLLQEHAAAGTSLDELAGMLDIEHIADHLYTKGQPDPDLVIRTSGEQRLSGFLLWQSAHSEFYFCEAYWPNFRKVDFLRALRAFSLRQRRYGA